jgi:hypothetical protein
VESHKSEDSQLTKLSIRSATSRYSPVPTLAAFEKVFWKEETTSQDVLVCLHYLFTLALSRHAHTSSYTTSSRARHLLHA